MNAESVLIFEDHNVILEALQKILLETSMLICIYTATNYTKATKIVIEKSLID